MFCKYCGQKIQPSRFCAHCGRSLIPADQQVRLAIANSPRNNSADGNKEVISTDQRNVCPFCKEEIRPGAIKCKHCSSDLSTRTATPQTDGRIREELRKYRSVVSMQCLECGYEGPMGLVRQIKPLWQQRWLLFLILFGIGIPLFIFSYVFGKPLRNVVVCPACRRTLVSQNAPAENSVFFLVGR